MCIYSKSMLLSSFFNQLLSETSLVILSADSDARFLVTMFPDNENSLSHGTVVAGEAKVLLDSCMSTNGCLFRRWYLSVEKLRWNLNSLLQIVQTTTSFDLKTNFPSKIDFFPGFILITIPRRVFTKRINHSLPIWRYEFPLPT